MIDEKMLAKDEADLRIFAAELKDDAMTEQAEIIRLARRYLALRKHGVLMGMPHNLKLVSDDDLDAAADRLLEGGE